MAKGSGGTRNSKLSSQATAPVSASTSFKEYSGYSDSVWQKTYYSEKSEGYVVTQLSRLNYKKNNQEIAKYEKEKAMCQDFADFGFKVEHLGEVPGVSSSDVMIKGYGKHGTLVRINGDPADLKALSSANNIRRHAKHATESQGAVKVLFKFTSRKDEASIVHELDKLSQKGIHGYYYFAGDKAPKKF